MKFQPRFLHIHKWLLLVFFTLLAILLTLVTAKLRPLSEVDWLDCIAEGGIALMALIWIAVTLFTRPKGLVTNLLFAGLCAMYLTMLWDFLDELVVYTPRYLTSFEAIPACIGMILMSIAAYYWYQEQTIVNQTLLKKERFYRDHSMTDFVTGLYSLEYMQSQVRHEQQLLQSCNQPFALTLFDVCDFAQFSRQHGNEKSNQLLRDIADMLSLSMRTSDVLCRFAADKFVVLHSHTKQHQAQALAKRAAALIAQHASYDTANNLCQFSAVNWISIEVNDANAQFDNLLETLMTQLIHQKNQAA